MAEKKTEATEAKGSSNKLKLILIILIVFLVLGAGGGAAYYFLVMRGADQAGAPAEGDAVPAAGELAPPPQQMSAPSPLIYHALDPITVNITAPGSARFLRTSITIATHNEAVVAAVERHLPMIRNDLLSRLADQDSALVNTPEGKDALREELRKLISGILTRAGEPSGIEAILFTDLVMQ